MEHVSRTKILIFSNILVLPKIVRITVMYLASKLLIVLPLRACLHGKRVPLVDRDTLPGRVKDTTILREKF